MADVDFNLQTVWAWLLAIFAALTLLILALAVFAPEPKSYSLYVDHEPIRIEQDYGFETEDAVSSGDGSAANPYVIEGLRISSGITPYITVYWTTAHVIIRNVSLEFTGGQTGPAIFLSKVSNVLLDNVTITGFRWGGDAGVFIEGWGEDRSDSIELRHCVISSCVHNILCDRATNLTVNRCLLGSSYGNGTVIKNSTSVRLTNNQIEGGGLSYWFSPPTYPLLICASQNVNLTENRVRMYYGSSGGPRIDGCEDVMANGNEFTSSALDVGAFTISNSENVRAAENLFTGGVSGLFLSNVNDCVVTDNQMTNAPESRALMEHCTDLLFARNRLISSGGFSLNWVSDVLAESNIVWGGTYGGWVTEASNVTIRSNLMAKCDGGLRVNGTDVSVIDNVIAQNNQSDGHEFAGGAAGGIMASAGERLTVVGNRITAAYSPYNYDGPFAFYAWGYSDVSITGNNLTGGLYFSESTDIDVTSNWIQGPGEIDYSGNFVGRIVNNTLVDITVPHTPVGLVWNDTYPEGGNYWSQYSGVDLRSGAGQNQPGSDGIGDDPFTPITSSTDYYPLMNPVTLEDHSAPVTVPVADGTRGHRDWFTTNVTVNLTAYDAIDGVAETHYRVDSGSWESFSTLVNVTGEGVHTVEYYSVDTTGNEEDAGTIVLKIDTEAPQVAGLELAYEYRNTISTVIEFSADDNTSGILYYAEGGELYTYDRNFVGSMVVELEDGEWNYTFGAVDRAGNQAEVVVTIRASFTSSYDPMNSAGPYGPWYSAAVLMDIVLLVVVVVLTLGIRPRDRPPKEPGEKDKEVDVVDGLPKYIKKA